RYFAHVTPEGRTLRDRLAAGGLQGQVGWGENIARYPRGGRALLEFWLESPGHRENIETCAYTHHGLGGAGEYWTHVFLTRRPAR
ncbi:MAG: CAP domain-containing protein, partial [Gemmatimonadota bacterium]|nr:CAP domain-containing protein [Gemmatimonadota bacterium]